MSWLIKSIYPSLCGGFLHLKSLSRIPPNLESLNVDLYHVGCGLVIYSWELHHAAPPHQLAPDDPVQQYPSENLYLVSPPVIISSDSMPLAFGLLCFVPASSLHLL